MSLGVLLAILYCAVGVALAGVVMDELYAESPEEFRKDWLICYFLLVFLAFVWGVIFLKFWIDDHAKK